MYYRFRPAPTLEGVYDVIEPHLNLRWLSGRPHPMPLPNPLEVELDAAYGKRMADLFSNGILVMSDRLFTALQRAGVTNIETYPAVLIDKRHKLRIDGYKAVQIIGRASVLDPEKSRVWVYGKSPGSDILGYETLVINEKAIGGLPILRMNESTSTILISEHVKKELDKEQWQGVAAHPIDQEPEVLHLDDYAVLKKPKRTASKSKDAARKTKTSAATKNSKKK